MINILFVSGVCVANASTMDNALSIEITTNALTKINKPKTLKVAETIIRWAYGYKNLQELCFEGIFPGECMKNLSI
jgi:hypothetical protein